jgi:hypothetical protein
MTRWMTMNYHRGIGEASEVIKDNVSTGIPTFQVQ